MERSSISRSMNFDSSGSFCLAPHIHQPGHKDEPQPREPNRTTMTAGRRNNNIHYAAAAIAAKPHAKHRPTNERWLGTHLLDNAQRRHERMSDLERVHDIAHANGELVVQLRQRRLRADKQTGERGGMSAPNSHPVHRPDHPHPQPLASCDSTRTYNVGIDLVQRIDTKQLL